jgi:hypothetical protein
MFVYKYQTVDPYGHYMWATKSFKSQKDLFRYLVEEKEEVLAQKKSIVKRAEGGLSMMLPVESLEQFTTKGIKPVYENDKEAGILKRTIVANTYWWMDSHSDVHLGRGDDENGKAVFTNTIKNRVNRIFPTNQHDQSLDGKIGKTLALYEAPVSWRALGVGKTGMTEALFADAQIEKERNEKRYKDYLNNEIDQHSVGMRYLDIQTAVNDKDYGKEYELFQKYIGKLGNRSAAERQGFFFPVAEAYLGEYSAVRDGSNELTPTLGQPSGDTGKEEPSGDTQNKQLLEAINKLSTLINN